MSRPSVEREIRRRSHEQAVAGAKSIATRLESGATPSGLYHGQRVEVLAVQDHPVAGARVSISTGVTNFWVAASEVTDLRGEPRRSIVPDGLF